MAGLYLDTSERLAWGILNENFEWILYDEYPVRQAASTIHQIIATGLREKNLSIEMIKEIFVLGGPGSYTGIRIAEGIAQVFEWQGIKTYSFYANEIPFLCGVESGIWIGEAFKGDLFEYRWQGQEGHQRLIRKADYELPKECFEIYSHYSQEMGEQIKLSARLIQNESKQIFKKVRDQNLRREPFYYRTGEEEFKVGGKRMLG